MFNLIDAVELASKAHAGQVDKTGVDYILHPLAVSGLIVLLPSFHSLSKHERDVALMAAVLHDVIEDSVEDEFSLTHLGVPSDVVNVVKILTRTSDDIAVDYYSRIKADRVARCVKTADLLHNNLPSRKSGLSESDAEKLSIKYSVAIPAVVSELDWDFFVNSTQV
jgi:(p)ppGpp synthase/HD superfamily hydrolase